MSSNASAPNVSETDVRPEQFLSWTEAVYARQHETSIEKGPVFENVILFGRRFRVFEKQAKTGAEIS